MSRFAEIEAFIEVAHQGSFTRAAEQLTLSRSRVSQLVQRLEDRLGVRLMQRTTRSLTLTSQGEQFLQRCRSGMNLLSSAEADLKMMSHKLTGPVRINSVGGIFGEQILAHALSDLVISHPELSVTIDYSSALVDLDRDPVDLVMRIGHAPAENSESAFLGDVHHTLCAGPSFVNQHGYPQQPDDLQKLPTVCGTPKIWELEQVSTGRRQVITPQANWRSGNTNAQVIATEAGLGVSRLLTLAAKPGLDAGRLVSVMPDWRIEPTYLWLMWQRNEELSVRNRTVRDHLIHHISAQLRELS